MQNRFLKWSKKKYTEKQRLAVMIPLGMFFLIGMPYLFVRISNIDKKLNIPRVAMEPLTSIMAAALIIFGLVFAFWSIQVEFSLGKGTPVPMTPTQKLIVTGPFLYCRNPMALGAICAYLGVVVFVGYLSPFVLLVILTAALLAYIKGIEEKELEARFGEDYLEYKKRVPFIIPRRR